MQYLLFRKDTTPTYSAYNCIQSLINITKQQSRDHGALSDIYSNSMTSRLQDIVDDHKRIFGNVSTGCESINNWVGKYEELGG